MPPPFPRAIPIPDLPYLSLWNRSLLLSAIELGTGAGASLHYPSTIDHTRIHILLQTK